MTRFQFCPVNRKKIATSVSLNVTCHLRENSDEVIKDFLGLGVGEFHVANPVSLTGNLQRIGAIPPEEDLGDFSGSLVRAVTLT